MITKNFIKGIAFAVFLLIGSLIATSHDLMAASASKKKEDIKTNSARDVVYPVNTFNDGKAHHFEYKTDDSVKIRYFILKSSDGVIRAAFDACMVCWQEGKGYVQKDDFMVCRNCGRRFPSTKINVLTGGCNPVPLARKTEGGNIVIKANDILEGKRFFAFARR